MPFHFPTVFLARPTSSIQQQHHQQSQQQQQQQQQSSSASSGGVDPDVQAYVNIKPDPLDHSRIKYTCQACQFSPKQLSLLVEHVNAVHLRRKHLSCSVFDCAFATSRKKALQAHLADVHGQHNQHQQHPHHQHQHGVQKKVGAL